MTCPSSMTTPLRASERNSWIERESKAGVIRSGGDDRSRRHILIKISKLHYYQSILDLVCFCFPCLKWRQSFSMDQLFDRQLLLLMWQADLSFNEGVIEPNVRSRAGSGGKEYLRRTRPVNRPKHNGPRRQLQVISDACKYERPNTL